VRRVARAESFSRVVQDETLSGYPISRIAMSSERALSWMPRSRLCVACFRYDQSTATQSRDRGTLKTGSSGKCFIAPSAINIGRAD